MSDERRIAELASRLVEQLRAGEHYVHLGMLTDQAGLAFLIDVHVDTVRKWRTKNPTPGPDWMELHHRVVYDVETVAEWMVTKKSLGVRGR